MALLDEDSEFIREEPEVAETEPHHNEEGPLQPNDVGEVEELHGALKKVNEQIAALQLEVDNLKAQVSQGKARIKEIWCTSCEELLKHDEELAAKDREIAELRKAHSAIELQSSDSQSVLSESTMGSVLVMRQENVLDEPHPLTTLQENHQRPSLLIGSPCWRGLQPGMGGRRRRNYYN